MPSRWAPAILAGRCLRFSRPENVNYSQAIGGVDFPTFLSSTSVVPTNLVAASLRVFTFEIQSTNDRVTLELHQVATALSTLTDGGTGLTNVFEDLGDGDLYAAHTVPVSQGNSFISIPLHSNAVAAMAAADGERFAIGGRLAGLLPGDTNEQSLFGYSYGTATNVQLVLTFVSASAPIFVLQPPPNLFTRTGRTNRLTVEAVVPRPFVINGSLMTLRCRTRQTGCSAPNINTGHAGNTSPSLNSFGSATRSHTCSWTKARQYRHAQL